MIGNWYYDNVPKAWRMPLLCVALLILMVAGGVLGMIACGPIGSTPGNLLGLLVFAGLFYPVKKEW